MSFVHLSIIKSIGRTWFYNSWQFLYLKRTFHELMLIHFDIHIHRHREKEEHKEDVQNNICYLLFCYPIIIFTIAHRQTQLTKMNFAVMFGYFWKNLPICFKKRKMALIIWWCLLEVKRMIYSNNMFGNVQTNKNKWCMQICHL